MDRHRAESGMIRQPPVYMMGALPFELPALCIAHKLVIYINQRTIMLLSLIYYKYAAVYVQLMGPNQPSVVRV